MANTKYRFGRVVANPFQCPTNMIKPKACEKCASLPMCKDFLALADITGKVIGFRHSQYKEYEGCLKPLDGIVMLKKPVDVSADNGKEALKMALCNILMKYDIPDEDSVHPDICTIILECDIKLDITDEGISHIGQTSITHLVIEGGEEIPFTRMCTLVTTCSYQNTSDQEVTEAEVLAAVPNAVNISIESKDVGGVTVYTYSFDLVEEVLEDGILIGGNTPVKCGESCEYVETEESGEKLIQEQIDAARSLGIKEGVEKEKARSKAAKAKAKAAAKAAKSDQNAKG